MPMNDQFQTYLQDGRAAVARGAWDDAERCFRSALVVRPQSTEALSDLGHALISAQKFAAAETVWSQVVQVEPDSAEAQRMLGIILGHKQDLKAAQPHLERALALNPNFDDVAYYLGRMAHQDRNMPRAAGYYEHAHSVNPLNVKSLISLVNALTELRREADAVAVGTKGVLTLRAHPDIPPVSYNPVLNQIAHAYRCMNDMAKAAECYRDMLTADPGDKVAQHLLASAEGKISDAQPVAFAQSFFDTFAPNFENHLVGLLGYGAPAVIVTTLLDLRPKIESFPGVLDLGCGTGLMGHALVQSYPITRLVGVDLSEKMLREAVRRGIYHELVAGDLAEVMAKRSDTFDLIVSADVFEYLGDLRPLFTQAQRCLTPDGIFAFTVEISATHDVELAQNGHYRHGREYIQRLAREAGFEVVRTAEAPIRNEAQQPVLGYYVYLTKSAKA